MILVVFYNLSDFMILQACSSARCFPSQIYVKTNKQTSKQKGIMALKLQSLAGPAYWHTSYQEFG